MIEIKKYAVILHDIRGKINEVITGDNPRIETVVVSPKEEHLIKKLKDKEGIILCGNFPSCDTTMENSDNQDTSNDCLLFLLEKIPAGSQTDGEELDHFAYMQSIMEKVKANIIQGDYSCEFNFSTPKQIRTEWEYNIYGGFNGLSIGFDLKEND